MTDGETVRLKTGHDYGPVSRKPLAHKSDAFRDGFIKG